MAKPDTAGEAAVEQLDIGGDGAAAAAPIVRPRRRRRERDRRWKAGLLLPAVIVVTVLTIVPLIWTLGTSFTDFNLFRHGFQKDVPVRFVGFDNWVKVFTDAFFWATTKNTVVFAMSAVFFEFSIGLAIALALRHITRGQRFFRVWFLLPLMVSPVAVGMIIGRMVFHETVGPVNDILKDVGLGGVPWLTNGFVAMITLIAVDVWQNTSFMMIILLAALQGVPEELYEAARVDGASDSQTFWRITLPMIMPIGLTAILIRGLDAFKVVDIIKVVTGGGPGTATESLTLRIFDIAVKSGDISRGAAGGYALLIIMSIFTVLVLVVARRLIPSQ